MIRDHQKNRVYSFFEWWVGTALNHYFDGVEVRGLDKIPRNVPVIFTSNHENALLDPLLIILAGPYQPFSVARSDVFKEGWVARFLHFIRMYPAYRPRDGREKMAREQFRVDFSRGRPADGAAPATARQGYVSICFLRIRWNAR